MRVDTDAGISGWGEGSTWAGGSALITEFGLRQIRDMLIGRDPSQIEAIWHDIYRRYTYMGSRGLPTQVLSAIDIALWDIKGKDLGRPIYDLLGGKVRENVPVYANAWWPDDAHEPQAFADAALETVARGHQALKLDPFFEMAEAFYAYVSGEITPQHESLGIARIAAIREAVGPNIHILIDAHGQYDVPSAIRVADRLAELDIAWLEEPVPPESHDALRQVRENTAVPICVGERLFTRFDFAPILERRLADFIMPDVCWTGGISELRRDRRPGRGSLRAPEPAQRRRAHPDRGGLARGADHAELLSAGARHELDSRLQRAAAGAAGIRARLPDGQRPAGSWRRHRRGLPGAEPLLGLGMKITGVERIELDVGFTPRTEPHMRRGIADFSLIEICRVTTDTGIVGWGESRAMHNWDRDMDAVDAGVLGRNPAELLWRDELGSGLQQAMFDVTGKSLGVPAHRLIGRQARAWAPLAWWCYDMPPEDWAAEAEDALAAGYTAFKLKPRPWFDLMAPNAGDQRRHPGSRHLRSRLQRLSPRRRLRPARPGRA